MPYIVLIIFLAFVFSFISKKKNLKTNSSYKSLSIDFLCFCFCAFILILFYGLRWNVGIDYMSYYNNVLQKRWMKPQPGTSDIFEFGFQCLYYLSDFFELPTYFYAVFGGFIIYLFLMKGIYENSINFPLSVFIFFASGLLFFSFNEFRQFIAVSILFYGLKYCRRKCFLKWTFFILLGSLFHKSCLFFTPLFFICKKSFSKKTINFFLILILFLQLIDVIVILKFLLSFLPGRYSNYADVFEVLKNEGTGFVSYIYLIIMWLLNNSKNREKYYKEKNIVYINSFLIATFLLNVFSEFYLITRIAEYCLISIVIVFPIFYKDSKSNMFRYILFLGILFFFVLNLIKYSLFSPETNLLTYQTVFSRYN